MSRFPSGLAAIALWALASSAFAAPPESASDASDASANDAVAETGAVELHSPKTAARVASESGSDSSSGAHETVRAVFEIPVATAEDPYGPRPPGVPRLSREQILRYALENPAVEAAEAKIDAMEAQARKANWAWFPVIKASAFLSPGVNVRCEDVRLDEVDASGNPIDFQYCRSVGSDGDDLNVQRVSDYLSQLGKAGIALRLEADFVIPVYTFGKLATVKKMAKVGVAAAELEAQATRQETFKRVAEAHAALLLARESVRILEEGWRLLEKERGKLAPAKSAGAEDWESDLDSDGPVQDPKDLIQLEVGEIELARRMREARKFEALALSALWTLAGEAAPEGFDLESDRLTPREVNEGLQPLSHYVELAREARPEAKMAAALVQVRTLQRKLARRNFLPDIGVVVSAKYGYASAADDFGPALYYTGRPNYSSAVVGLGLQWRLDFHNKAFDLQQAEAETRRANAQRETALALLDLEVEQAYRDYRAARDDAGFAAMARDKSWQLVVTEQQRQTVGEPDFNELRKALVQWAEYEFEHFEAIQKQNVALARLERATGTPLAQSTAAAQAGSTANASRSAAAKADGEAGASAPVSGPETAPEGPDPADSADTPAP